MDVIFNEHCEEVKIKVNSKRQFSDELKRGGYPAYMLYQLSTKCFFGFLDFVKNRLLKK